MPVTVVPEVAYLLSTRLNAAAERAFARSLAAHELDVEPLQDADVRRAADLLETNPAIGFVDASIAAIRPSHLKAFDLVP